MSSLLFPLIRFVPACKAVKFSDLATTMFTKHILPAYIRSCSGISTRIYCRGRKLLEKHIRIGFLIWRGMLV